jgi:hypothetical protein
MGYTVTRQEGCVVREAAPERGGVYRTTGHPDPTPTPTRHRAPDPPGPPPDPFEDPDGIAELEDEITTLAAHIHAANHRLLVLLAEFDRRRGWKLAGHRNCADWLHFRTGIARGAAREKVRTARALVRMPLTGAAMARGELSYSKVRGLSRVVDDLARVREERGLAPVPDPEAATAGAAVAEVAAAPDPEAELVDYARQCTTAQVERFVREWRWVSRTDEAEVERRRHRARYLSIAPDGDGTYVLRGRLTPKVGAVLMRAVEAASDVLFREGPDWAPEGGERGPRTEEVTSRQRRADALGLLAEQALAVGFGGGAEPRADSGVEDERGAVGGELDDVSAETGGGAAAGAAATGHEACTCRQPNGAAPLSGTRAERYQVFLHVDERTLGVGTALKAGDVEARGEESAVAAPAAATGPDGLRGRAPVPALAPTSFHLDDGTPVSGETSRRFTCDASVVPVTRGRDGSVLDVGRRTRTIPPALRRALEVRDGGCRFPGCGLRFTEGHHIVHWKNGGETKLSNLVLLCRHHHRAVHEEGFRVRMHRDGRIQFYDRTGWPLPDFAPPSSLGGAHANPVSSPAANPDGALDPVQALIRSNRARGVEPAWDTPASRYRLSSHIPWELEARAREALDPSD